ncbi:MAG: DUF4139 domain-containing protein [Caldithrix sp.]|nr:MAG: DUF4139 domain-containing protein [Caldithrix sp.]
MKVLMFSCWQRVLSSKIRIPTFMLLLASVGFSFADENEVTLTVYNNNLALVREVRTLELQKGRFEVRFQDVAAKIDPTSVFFSSLTAPDKVAILEQNFEYDLVNSNKILQKYLDQTIRIEAKGDAVYEGTLLSSTRNDVILQVSDGSIRIVNRETVENITFPKLPAGLITRPTLVWSVDCQQPGKHKTEIGYLTAGINWHAEYVGVTNSDDTRLQLSGWVSIDNKSGATYNNAKLKLVAGDVHRARVERQKYPLARTAALQATTPDGFKEKAFFEYHLYTLQRPTTVANNQTKQVSLFPAADVAIEKKYIYDGARSLKKVRVNLEFENRKASGLGMPLPKGKARIYKQDDDGSLVFVGEDFIEHTPQDELVRIYVGNAFDIVGERKQKERHSTGKNAWEETWEIKLRNHKEQAVQVLVVEHFGLDWEIRTRSHDFEKRDAQTIEFKVTVPKDGEVTVNYVVRYNR